MEAHPCEKFLDLWQQARGGAIDSQNDVAPAFTGHRRLNRTNVTPMILLLAANAEQETTVLPRSNRWTTNGEPNSGTACASVRSLLTRATGRPVNPEPEGMNDLEALRINGYPSSAAAAVASCWLVQMMLAGAEMPAAVASSMRRILSRLEATAS